MFIGMGWYIKSEKTQKSKRNEEKKLFADFNGSFKKE